MIRVHPAPVEGRLRAPPSKSHTHRAHILAALTGNGLVRNPLDSDDTQATLDALHALGFLVTREADGVRVGGTLRGTKKPLDARNSGTTLRLLAAIASLHNGSTALIGGASLRTRPVEPLLSALRQLGVHTESEDGHVPVSVRGPLRGGACDLSGDVSSQFLSGLLLAASFAPDDTTIRLTTPLTSRPYVDITLHALRLHGGQVHERGGEFHVPGDQKMKQATYDVPGDWSSAAYLLAAAAVTGGRLTLTHLPVDDAQGDRAILDHLRAFGCRAARSGDAVTLEGGPLEPVTIDVGPTPDLFPALAIVAACARGTSTISGAPHLRVKESDRIHAMRTNLERFGIRCEELPDGLRVHGGRPRGAAIESAGDHRIAMALLALGLAADGETTLPDPDVLTKSYPGFAEDLARVAKGVVLA